MSDNYQKSYEELEAVASKFWPSELSEIESRVSIIPHLLRTQEQFIGIIGLETPNLENLFRVIEASSLSPNLFLKHLAILTDFGGEMLSRVGREFRALFPNGELRYLWHGEPRSYRFRALPSSSFGNTSLRIDGKQLLTAYPLDDLMRDAIALLLFGSSYADDDQEVAATLAKCEAGEYLGKPEELRLFIRQRYIWVSRITGGATSNNLGQIAQRYVGEYINEHLGISGITVQHGGRLPGVTHTDSDTGRMTSFDLVVTNGEKHVAIEVSFQVTTNSVIERKSGQARSRFEQVERAGHRICYVIDGSGNFQRETALRTICSYSHCTVAFSRSELEVLCAFLREQY